MTIGSATNKSGPYNGNGATVAFSYGFRITDQTHIQVIKTVTATGVETVQTLTTHYTVSGVGDAGGGLVTMVTAPATGTTITLILDVPFTQGLDLQNQGAYFAQDIEDALDRAAQRDLQMLEQVARSVKISASSDIADLDALVADIERLGDSAANIDTVAGIAANVTTVAGISANVTTVAGIAANVTTVAGISANVTTVAGIAANVTTVATNVANVNTVAGISGNVTTVAGIAANVTTVAGIAAAVSTVATNIADITNFSDVYQGGKAAAPTLRNDGSALQAGDLYFNTVADTMYVYDGAAWTAASGSSLNINAKSFVGDGVDTTFTLDLDPGVVANVLVEVAGVLKKPTTDYTVTGTTLTFTTAPANLAEINTWVIATVASLLVPADDSVTLAKLATEVTDYIQQESRRNRLVNPAMQVSQENGNTAGTTTGYYVSDQWAVYRVTSAGTITGQRVQSVTPNGSKDRARITITAADASLAAGEYLTFTQNIEGQEVADFQYGTAAAIQSVLRFGFKGPAGTYAVALHNSGAARSYVALFTISAGQANTDTEQTVVITGDTAGTWLKDTGIGITLDIVLACGSTFQGAAGWQAGNIMGTSGVSNGMATVSDVFEIFDVGLYADPDATGVAPAWEMPDAAAELRRCLRYFWMIAASRFFASGTVRTPATDGYVVCSAPVQMRITPAASWTNAPGVAVGGATGTVSTLGMAGDTEVISSYVATGAVGAQYDAVVLYTNAGGLKISARM